MQIYKERCSYASKYKGIREPKCGCKLCWDVYNRLNMTLIKFEEYDNLRDVVYSHHKTGGPLHIVTDDNNLADEHLEFCEGQIEKSDDPLWLKQVMYAILSMLKEIKTEEDREWFVTGMDITV